MKLIKYIALILFCYLLFLFLYVSIQLTRPVGTKENIEVYIPKGASFSQIASILKEKNVIRNELVFIITGRMLGIEKKARAGYYLITPQMSVVDVIKELLEGKIIEYQITIVEGDSLYEIADKLGEINPKFKEELWQLTSDKSFLKSLNIDAPSLEGYIYPDTYLIPKGMELKEILTIMVKRMWQIYDEKLRAETVKKGWTVNKILTLASIIEKEAKLDEEKPIISAVYHNRLKIGMPLQADPTAIYGVKRFKEGVKKSDLKNNTPYNTYIIKGLPPGPIASPSIKSIKAALNPANVNYIYFVAKGDGSHVFSVDYKEHVSAINKIRGENID
ncbi:endolytic transglycosylase MltG [Thermodesulfovibrio hydrogeniphilus]